MDQKPRVIIAIRVSTAKQIEDGYGHEAQLQRLPALVAEKGWVLAKRPDGSDAIYDEGFASTTPRDPRETSLNHRPVMQALLAELDYTRPTYLVCRQLDRLQRDEYEYAYIVKYLMASGARGFADAPSLEALHVRDITDPRDGAMASIEAIFSNLQKADLKIKLMVGRRERARQGKPNGGRIPYGYRRPLRKEAFRIDEDEAKVYRRMVSRVIDDKWGSARIANELVKGGVPNRSGVPEWSATTVRRILLSKAQCGYIRVKFASEANEGQWVQAEGQEPIITEDTWNQMREVLDSRPSEKGHNQKRHALAGLLRCGVCGKTLKANPDNRRSKGAGKYINYSCRVYNSGCSAGYSISEPKALKELATWVNARLAATDEAGWRDDLVTAEPDVGQLEDRVSLLASQVAKLTRRRDRAYSLYVDAEDGDEAVAKAEYEARRDHLTKATADLEAARRDYGVAQTSDTQDELSIEELRDVLSGWLDFPANEKRAALSAVIDHAILGPPNTGPRTVGPPKTGPRLTIVAAGAAADGVAALQTPGS